MMMTQVEAFFWVFMCTGATLTALAIVYRLGHTVGYRQAERLTLPRFEILDQPEPLSTDAVIIDEEAAPLEEETAAIQIG